MAAEPGLRADHTRPHDAGAGPEHGRCVGRSPLEAEKAAARVFQAAGIETTWRHAGTGTVDDDLMSMIIINLMSASMEARMKAPATVMGFAVSGARLASIMYGRVERLAQVDATDLATCSVM